MKHRSHGRRRWRRDVLKLRSEASGRRRWRCDALKLRSEAGVAREATVPVIVRSLAGATLFKSKELPVTTQVFEIFVKVLETTNTYLGDGRCLSMEFIHDLSKVSLTTQLGDMTKIHTPIEMTAIFEEVYLPLSDIEISKLNDMLRNFGEVEHEELIHNLQEVGIIGRRNGTGDIEMYINNMTPKQQRHLHNFIKAQ